MKNLTPVEWLIKYLTLHGVDLNNDAINNVINIAKEIEKQQIIEAHGSKLKNSKGETNFQYWYNGQDYYNDTSKNTEDEKILNNLQRLHSQDLN